MEPFENSTLDLLIDPTTRQWIDELVDILFALDEAEIIKKIPLARVAAEDIDWPYSHGGKYNCKSGYKFLKEELDLLSSQQPSCHDKHLWTAIWSLHVLQKMKNLLW